MKKRGSKGKKIDKWIRLRDNWIDRWIKVIDKWIKIIDKVNKGNR